MTNEPHSHISIKGSDLVSAYGVYLVLIKDKETTYCYIGQTGDAKYIAARSPFYRIAAHLGYAKNTQNQVYEGLKKAIKLSTKKEMENWLVDKTIDIHFFKTDDFEFMIDTPANKQTHTYKRRRTLVLESALLQVLKEKNGLNLLNQNHMPYKDFEKAVPRANEIMKTIGL